MSEHLSPADVSFFYLEGRTTPQHVGGLAIFEAPADGFDYDRLIRLLEERISLAPRYRQRMRTVPGNLANPIWVDDPRFDITYHVRRSALPRPGTDTSLLEFCARIQSRLLDRDRPLWEMYLVEGLTDGRIAVLTKTHHSMVDGVGAIDIAQVLLDSAPEPRRTVEGVWMPEPEPSSSRLVVDALAGAVRRPAAVVDIARLVVGDARSASSWLTGAVAGSVAAVRDLVRTPQPSPLRATLSEHRRIGIARAELDDFRLIRDAHGGTVNDAVLATVAGGLRRWLLSRGERLQDSSTVRALVPVSVSGVDEFASGGERSEPVTALLVDLPVGEADPLRRLARVQFEMAAHTDSGQSVSADTLVALSGFAPPTLHSLGARAANRLTRRMYSLVVTNVPGPQIPLYAAGARMTEMFPILPLNEGQALSIALTSYNGGVFFGVNADRDAVPDVNQVAGDLIAALGELVALSVPGDEETTLADPRSSRPARLRAAGRAAAERTVVSTRTRRPGRAREETRQ
ncbi:wax ester/triacylglycerol synthase family O-acyltransferase [Jatrophihabitans sp.]|uniref:WS/DGAT/MGAT family O-acyltransferase n=1 Tax=Jatrophihabitans sp. TaxID=1932789 RepID=UPI0030C67665|nr:acyltransferase [Jatrophihabitans sp.]